MVELLQLIVGGVAQGCVYGLIALGFVLIYKATEMVNFAQGDLMMLGSFVALTFIGTMGMNYWLGVLVAALAMAVFGYLLDAVVLRRIIGQPQFAVVILTISHRLPVPLGRRFHLGARDAELPRDALHQPDHQCRRRDPIAGASVHHLRHADPGRPAVSVLQLHAARQRHAGLLAEPAGGLLHGHPGQAHQFADLGALSAIVATIAGVLFAPVSLVDPSNGFYGIKAFAAAVIGGFGSLLGTVLGGLIIGVSETLAARYLPPGFKEIVAYLIMLGVLIVRPHGLFSTLQRKKV